MTIIVTNVAAPEKGGIQSFISAIAEELSRRGRTPILIAPARPHSRAYDAELPYRVVRYPRTPLVPLDVVMILFSYLRSAKRSRDRTTIAAKWWPSGFAVALLPKRLRGRMILLAHGAEISNNLQGVRRLLLRFTLSRAERVYANSSLTYDLLASAHCEANASIIELGVDAVRFDSSRVHVRRSSAPTILSVGRLIERKGFDRVIESVAELRHEIPGLRYVIVGSGPMRDRLLSLASERGVADRVELRGELPHDELLRAYAEAWVFAMPARRIGTDVEGFGIVFLEAALAELPAIAGRESGSGSAIVEGSTGYIVDGNDVSAIAATLRRLCFDAELRRRLGLAARANALTKTWESTVTEMMGSPSIGSSPSGANSSFFDR